MADPLKATTFVEYALEASVYVRPREPGLSLDELTQIGAFFSLKPGAIRDAVTSEVNMVERPIQGRARLKVGSALFNIHVSMQGDRRNVAVFETVAHFFRDYLEEHGKAFTEISREQLEQLGADRHTVDVELAMMELTGLVKLSATKTTITDLGVGYFRDFDAVGERASWKPQRPQFGEIYEQVEKTIRLRPPAVSVAAKPLRDSLRTPTLPESVRTPMIRVFVSHAAKNKTVAQRFVRMILESGIGVHRDEIFFSSQAGAIPHGKYYIPYIRDRIVDATLVICLITREFRSRPFCLAEMGAAWALVPDGFCPLLHNVAFDDMDGILQGMQAGKLSDKESLNVLRKDVTGILGLPEADHNRWEGERDEFIAKLAEFEARDG